MILDVVRRLVGVELIEVSSVETLVACIGGGLSILALAFITQHFVPQQETMAIVASMGASAVLLFAVPHGQLSQPWPVLVGHIVSAAIGVACAQYIPDQNAAAAIAVGLSIAAMIQLKCIHPPGGATALTAVIGGSGIRQMGFRFVSQPVLANALIMVLLAIIINNLLRWRRYPSILNRHSIPPEVPSPGQTHDSVLAAIRSIDSFVDINEEDLRELAAKLRSMQQL
ncbi:HPP family protein [Anatilimnocola floriformis]|uniref:HPP family protein n=1 Tax=Anatilimnocola floriformis TaxID=2948575 RepID=UPI0020C53208|nr:HPP family protein [Anatilimnocola floriformis]